LWKTAREKGLGGAYSIPLWFHSIDPGPLALVRGGNPAFLRRKTVFPA
jgi:hypothetical protein